MAAASPLLLPREPIIYRKNGYFVQPKSTMDKGQLHSSSITLSSHYSQQDGWSLHLLNSAYGPLTLAPTRCSVCLCRALLKPGRGHEIPVLKTASAVLMRSYNAFHGSSLVLQLVPALGVIAFAAWGLGPLLRIGRTLFLHKSDNSWQKSSTHHVFTSYLQPVLLWTGATLLCRALDHVVLPSVASQAVKQRLLSFVRSLSTVMAFAYCLSSLIQQTQKFFVEAKDSSDARNMSFEFAGKAVYTAVWVAALSLFMELLGFSTQKWLTAGGLGTVLLTLAGREIFTNFLSSIMIHATRPFILNDWIQTKIEGYEVSGTVEHVGWWSPTVIRGDDREAVHIPNHKFTVTVVRNLSQKTHWRIKTHLAISHLDVNKINNIVADMRKVLAKSPQVEQQKLHRRVFLDNVDPENQALKTSHFEEYLGVKEAILLDLLRVISHHRARLATPIRTVQKIYREANVEDIPFVEPIFSSTRETASRPLLLIEPSYKINGDDKTKVTTRSAQSNEEKDAKVDPATAPDARAASTRNVDEEKNVGNLVSGSNNDANSKSKGGAGSLSDAKVPTTGKPDLKEVVADELLSGKTPLNSKDISTAGIAVEKQHLEELGGNKDSTSTSQAKPDGEQTIPSPPTIARPVIEENIVLGVALEGSKRTLPIEEDMSLTPTLTELKELAGSRNGNGSTAVTTDTKVDHGAAIPSGTSSERGEK